MENIEIAEELTHQSSILDVTALLVACKNGQLQDVRHLVQHCGVNVNRPGTLLWEEEDYEQTHATALQTAVIAGHLNVVQYLVEDCNAHINIRSTSRVILHHHIIDKGLSPLQVAISHLTDQIQIDIIRFLVKNGADLSACDRNGNPCWALTPDIDVTKLLIELGMDIQTTNEMYDTIVHVWASSPNPRSIEVMQLLFDKGADIHQKNCEGLTPLMIAAIELIYEPQSSMFQFLFAQEKQPISRSDKITALELMGAIYIVNEDLENGLMNWRIAMSFRFDIMPALPKVTTHLSEVAYKAFETSEVEDLEQLEEMAFYDPDSMKLQAQLMIYRILGNNIYQTWSFLTTHAMDCWASDDVLRFLNFSMLVLECSQAMESTWMVTADTIRRLAVAFYNLRSEESHAEDQQLVSFANVMAVLRCAAKELHRYANKNMDYEDRRNCDVLLDCVIQLTVALISMTMTEEENLELKHCLYHLVLLDQRSRYGCNLLLLAVSSSSYYFSHQKLEVDGFHWIGDFGNLPSMELVHLLLEVGADPDSKDEISDTGLHILAKGGANFSSPIVRALFEGGTHLDQTNMMGETFADLVHKDSPPRRNTIFVTPLEFPSLKCLTAREIRQQNLYSSFFYFIPSDLWYFILQH